MPRDMIENESSSAINPGEAVDESVSLSDRFGLWLGFGSSWAPEFADALDLELGITIGFCGGLTTFSTLCSDAIRLANQLGSRAAGLYLAETIFLGLSAFWLGALGLAL